MGLASLILGDQNPFAQYVAQNPNTIARLGAGFAQGTDLGSGLAGAAAGVAQGRPMDDAYATAQRTEAERLKAIQTASDQQNATLKYLQDKYPDLAQAVMGGLPIGEAWKESFARQAAGDKQRPLVDVAPGATVFDPNTGKPVFTNQTATRTENAPTGYRYDDKGNLGYIPGGPADPATAGKTTEATRRNQQLASVIVPEAQSLLGNGNVAGTFEALASGQDQARSMGGDIGRAMGQGPSAEFQQAQNSMKTIVASYLYSVSGATANPGEVQTQVDVLTPKIGENPASVQAKKARLKQMVEAVVQAAQGNAFTPPTQPIGTAAAPQTFTYNPATGQLE